MADNVAVTAGSGTTIATDDIGGTHYPRYKPVWGADGSATDTSHTNPLPICEGVQTGATSIGGTTSGTADTWTVLAASDSTRRKVFVQNNSASSIQIGLGANTVMIELAPGESWYEIAYTGAINVKCTTATSKTYIGYKLTA